MKRPVSITPLIFTRLLEAILTPEQMQNLQNKLNKGCRLQIASASLDLTTEQKTKMQMLFDVSSLKEQKAKNNIKRYLRIQRFS
jgi:Spy/CpxP family protein refolding chaperone